MKNKLKEIDFKRWFRSQLSWSEAIEPGLGAGVGVPDLLVMIESELALVELKIGEWRDGRLFCRTVRPAQINWHKRCLDEGGLVFTIVGTWSEKGWQAWYVYDISDWKKGWSRSQVTKWPNVKI